jgi:hypothetical protein
MTGLLPESPGNWLSKLSDPSITPAQPIQFLLLARRFLPELAELICKISYLALLQSLLAARLTTRRLPLRRHPFGILAAKSPLSKSSLATLAKPQLRRYISGCLVSLHNYFGGAVCP